EGPSQVPIRGHVGRDQFPHFVEQARLLISRDDDGSHHAERWPDDDACAFTEVACDRAAFVPGHVAPRLLRELAERARDDMFGGRPGQRSCQTTPWQFQDPVNLAPRVKLEVKVPAAGSLPRTLIRV